MHIVVYPLMCLKFHGVGLSVSFGTQKLKLAAQEY
jgi:hypothetical protein